MPQEDEDVDADEKEDEEEEEEEGVVQPMTLEADRRQGPTRGAMLDPTLQQDPKLRLEIGICGNTRPDGTETLEACLKYRFLVLSCARSP